MTGIVLTPRQEALRDLVLLQLHRAGGSLKDPSGRISSQIRELCGLPDGDQMANDLSRVFKFLEDAQVVVRDRRSPRDQKLSSTRTYALTLPCALTNDFIRRLEDSEDANKRMFVSMEDFEALYADCMRALSAIRSAAQEATRQLSGGAVAINVKGALGKLDIRGLRAAQVRHYLRHLGLIKSHGRVPGEDYLHWWDVDLKADVDREKLAKLATGGDRWVPKATRQSRGLEMNGPVTTRKVEPRLNGSTPVSGADSQPDDDDIGRLIRHMEQLEVENAELRERIGAQDTELERLRRENAELQSKIKTPDSRVAQAVKHFRLS